MVSAKLGMLHYMLDHVYGACVHRTKISPLFFSQGWGGNKLELLESIVKQLFPFVEGQNWPPMLVDPHWKTVWESKSASLKEGIFKTPCDDLIMGALPPESHNARVAFLAPKSVPFHHMACVLHLAGTGDHSFERRLRLGGPLLKENIATMVLESPFYGKRRPFLQRGAKLLCVSDLLLLGRVTIEEALSLLYWLDNEAGFGKMGVCGISMGGVHAAMVGSLHPTPIATLPFLSPHSAVVAFCDGVLKHATAWDALREDLAVQNAGMTLEEVRQRLRKVLSLTDVTQFPIPKSPDAVILVAATNMYPCDKVYFQDTYIEKRQDKTWDDCFGYKWQDDGYIPRESVLELQKAWPGSEVRWVTGGHVSSILLHTGEFRKAIVDSLNRLQWKESPL